MDVDEGGEEAKQQPRGYGGRRKTEEEGTRKVLPTNERNDIQDLYRKKIIYFSETRRLSLTCNKTKKESPMSRLKKRTDHRQKKIVLRGGFEPPTLVLLAPRSNQLTVNFG